MDEGTLGAIYLGKTKRRPPWEPMALVVMKPVIRLHFHSKNWTILVSRVNKPSSSYRNKVNLKGEVWPIFPMIFVAIK